MRAGGSLYQGGSAGRWKQQMGFRYLMEAESAGQGAGFDLGGGERREARMVSSSQFG